MLIERKEYILPAGYRPTQKAAHDRGGTKKPVDLEAMSIGLRSGQNLSTRQELPHLCVEGLCPLVVG
jgi:hypothetical protein